MNRRKAVSAVFVLLICAVSVFAQNVTIDVRMNIRAPDPAGNHLLWSFGNLNISDTFDAATGASKFKSTSQFDAVRYDSASARQPAIPGGLRSLFLFPLAAWDTAVNDALQVGVNGRMVIIRYVHRGSAYEFRTDANGRLNILTGCKTAAGITENNLIKPEYLKAGQNPANMSSLDWTKISLINDTYSPSASRYYEGMLNVAYSGGILTIQGTMAEKRR